MTVTGVIEHDVELAEFGDGVVDGPADVSFASDVAVEERGVRTNVSTDGVA